jgi:GT2 family glycosyltransferase
VSSFGAFGGTSTAFRKKLLVKVHGYDERYRYYREDTDLTFKIMDLGYGYKVVKADYVHDHKETAPKGAWNKTRYVLKRLRYHENDVLLYKNHPLLAGKFLNVKFGFLVSPADDFKVVANLWEGSSKQLKLGSPRGITLIENKSPLHALAIILAGIAYVFAVKSFRLWGSVKFRKLLI